MNTIDTPLKDLYILEPKVFEDERGYFYEAYNKLKLAEYNINIEFVQDNQSKSSYGVVRGLHYQMNPKAQTKLVRVLEGRIYDVAVDIRKNSPTFGHWFGIELSGENRKQLLVPQGFAHGFAVLSDSATVFYKCDSYYAPEADAGIKFDDPALDIDWIIPADKIVLSQKDSQLPPLASAKINFEY